jgi:hypothetical protein
MSPMLRWILAAFAVVLAACSQGKSGSAAGDTTARAGADTSRGMAGMPGMKNMQAGAGMMGVAMMDSMGAHIRTMCGMGAEQMESMLPMHRQMTANMVAQMNDQMRQMYVPASVDWTSTVDSVREDLVQMPDMSPRHLQQFMPAHCARVQRLLRMHQMMMQGTAR